MDTERGRRRRAPKKQRRIDGAETLCEITLVAVVLGSVLAIGTVHTPTLLAISALALVGGTLGAHGLNRLPPPAIVLAALGLFSAFQAISLPAHWVVALSPVSAQVWLRCLAPFGKYELARFPISLDAGASITEALKWLTYAAVYTMAVRVRTLRGSSWLAALLFISATLVSLVTLVHGVADLQLLYGLYQPDFSIGRWNVGPLLNSNNFAGYANLGLFTGVGLLIGKRPVLPRSPLLIGLGVISTALLLSGSRGGVCSAVACFGIVAVWFKRTQQSRVRVQTALLWLSPFVLGIAIAIALGTVKEFSQLASLDVQRKIAVWRWSLPMIRDHAWLGVGRGAFETAFPPYRQILDYDWTAVFSHAENFVVQWIAEWGIPVGTCATLLIVGYVLREWYASRTDRMRFVVLTGVAALMLQNLADLGLEIPAVMIAAVLALACAERPSALEPTEPGVAVRSLAAATPLLVIWVLAMFWSRWPVEVERREMASSYHSLPLVGPEERAVFRAELRSAMVRHPGESFFPLIGAVVAARARDQSPLPWLSRALELAPTNGRVHLVLAELLAAHNAIGQAMLHLRFATEYDRSLSWVTAARAAKWAPSLEVLLQAVPTGPAGDIMLATACGKESRIDFRIGCFREAVTRTPQDADLRGQLANSLLVALRSNSWPCNGALANSCGQEVDASARAMAKLDPRSWQPAYLVAKVFQSRGDSETAATLLAKVCPADAEGIECAREAVSAAIASRSDRAIHEATDRYAARGCTDSTACAEAFDWLGSTLEAGGNLAFAITYYTKAAEADNSAARWLRVADRATRQHLFGVARTALIRADRSPDASDNSRAHTAELMRRVTRGDPTQSF
jgi:hypothetical protein